MKTCGYCGSPIKPKAEGYYCSFCEMSLQPSHVKENHERLEVRVQEFALEEYIHKSTPELMMLSTFELIYLLKEARAGRSKMYHQNLVFHDAMDVSKDTSYMEYEKISGEEYTYITRKMFVLENLVRERLGYIPRRITDQLLVQYLDKIHKGKNGTMKISTERKKHVDS